MKKEHKFESPIAYHPGFGCWSLKNGTIGVSGMLLKRKSTVKFLVNIGDKLEEGMVVAEVNNNPIKTPFPGVVSEINSELESRPATGADWVVRL